MVNLYMFMHCKGDTHQLVQSMGTHTSLFRAWGHTPACSEHGDTHQLVQSMGAHTSLFRA